MLVGRGYRQRSSRRSTISVAWVLLVALCIGSSIRAQEGGGEYGDDEEEEEEGDGGSETSVSTESSGSSHDHNVWEAKDSLYEKYFPSSGRNKRFAHPRASSPRAVCVHSRLSPASAPLSPTSAFSSTNSTASTTRKTPARPTSTSP